MRALTPNEIKVILAVDGSREEDYEECIAVEATIQELADQDIGTVCGSVGNHCFKKLAKKYGTRRVRAFLNKPEMGLIGMPHIECVGLKEATKIQNLADKGDGSLRENGQSDVWPEFYEFEVE